MLCHFGVVAVLLAPGATSAQPSKVDHPTENRQKAKWTIPVLVLRYFPVTADKKKIDIAVTSNVDAPLKVIQAKCDRITREAPCEHALTEFEQSWPDFPARPRGRIHIPGHGACLRSPAAKRLQGLSRAGRDFAEKYPRSLANCY
jgi:hypothetical protein